MLTMETSEARLQAWLNSLTERFIRAPSTEIDSHLLDGLRKIVEYFDVDRSTLFEFDTDGRELTATHSWARDDVETFPASRIGEELPWYQARLAAGEQIVLNRLPDDLPEEAVEERNYCRRSGIRSNLTLPVRVGEFPVCALAVGSFRHAVTWNESTIEKVQLAARILAAGLIRLRQSRELDRARHLARDFFDSLDSMAAVLDRQGTIVGVNRAWGDRASGGCGLLDPSTLADPIGKSYLELLHRAAEGGNPWASKAAVRVSSVLKGEMPLSLMEFPSGDEPSGRWTLMRILERESEEGGAIVMNVDISARVEQTRQLERNLEEIERLRQALEEEKLYLKEEIKIDNDFENIVGRSDSLQATLSRIGRVAPTSATVLLLGETGTGKELLAHAIHERSARGNKALIKVNCAALPPSLIESELFGHVRGAFTGAVSDKKGRFELADGGTLFLDEVGDLALDLQAKLLSVLESGEFERVGGTTTIRVDVRLIAATHQDLKTRVASGHFREDLFHRLATVPIEVPPLRQRREDIPLLVWHFLERYEKESRHAIDKVSNQVMEAMQAYSWPGNVRELRNVVERAAILSESNELLLDPGSLMSIRPELSPDRDESLNAAMRSHILDVLERCDWRINGPGNTAERLGIHPNTLRHRLKKLGIERPS